MDGVMAGKECEEKKVGCDEAVGVKITNVHSTLSVSSTQPINTNGRIH
jgi:hypothetical protein